MILSGNSIRDDFAELTLSILFFFVTLVFFCYPRLKEFPPILSSFSPCVRDPDNKLEKGFLFSDCFLE